MISPAAVSVPGPDRHRSGRQAAPIAEAAAGRRDEALLQPVGIGDVHGAGRGEIALARPVGALADGHVLDELGDQEVEVGIALAVGVGAHVDRHAVEPDREVGAVVEVEAAQKILVGLSFARVLGDDQAGHRLEDLAGPLDRPRVERLTRDALLGGRIGRLGLEIGRRGDGDGGQHGGGADRGRGRNGSRRRLRPGGRAGEHDEAGKQERSGMHFLKKVHTSCRQASGAQICSASPFRSTTTSQRRSTAT